MKSLARLMGCTNTSALLKSNSEQEPDPFIQFCLGKSTHQMKSVTFVTKTSDFMHPNTTNPSHLPQNQDSVRLQGFACTYVGFCPRPQICLLSIHLSILILLNSQRKLIILTAVWRACTQKHRNTESNELIAIISYEWGFTSPQEISLLCDLPDNMCVYLYWQAGRSQFSCTNNVVCLGISDQG